MGIVVQPIDREFAVKFNEVTFYFKQLNYKTKAKITNLVTTIDKGQVQQDTTLTAFYNIKFGLKRVEGLETPEGKKYKLTFEDHDKTALHDQIVDELLATPLSDNLIFTGLQLLEGVPQEVTHPLTGDPIEGIEVIPPEKVGTLKKS
jgi:hypothetical protein